MFKYDGISFRIVEERDLADMRDLRNDPSTWMYLTSPGEITEEEQLEWFERLNISRDRRYYALLDEALNFMGSIRTDEIDWLNKSMRVGVDIIPEKRGQGYGTKAYGALLKYCFDHLNMHRVWLCVLDNNNPAISLYKKVGFQKEGKMRQAVWRDGKWRNYIIMSILKEEYKES